MHFLLDFKTLNLHKEVTYLKQNINGPSRGTEIVFNFSTLIIV